jgi:hypothetical protein
MRMMSKFCENPHHIHCLLTNEKFPIKCGKCDPCISLRKIDLVNRFQRSDINEDPVEMWTLGSNLEMDLYYGSKDNTWIMKEAIKTFQKRLRAALKYGNSEYKWTPIYRVLEYGTSGYLHWHIITKRQNHRIKVKYKGTTFTGIQKLVRKVWSDTIGIENPNVNYSYKKNYTPAMAFKYVTKYLNKSGYVTSYMSSPLWRKIEKKHTTDDNKHDWRFHSNKNECEAPLNPPKGGTLE